MRQLNLLFATLVVAFAGDQAFAEKPWEREWRQPFSVVDDFRGSRIEYIQTGEKNADVFIIGEIGPGSADQFHQSVINASNNGLVLRNAYLFSTGGDVEESMEIGRFVRKFRISTVSPYFNMGDRIFSCIAPKPYNRFSKYIDDTAEYVRSTVIFFNSDESEICICASACTLIWLGGLERSGHIAVHRAYLQDHNHNFSDFEGRLGPAYTAIEAYLSEMRAPSWVGDAIFQTESNTIKVLNSPENDSVIGNDPVFDEYISSQCPPDLSGQERQAFNKLTSDASGSRKLSVTESAAWSFFSQKQRIHSECKSDLLLAERRAAQQVPD